MYKFYKDKDENFECKINIEGASLSNATARLVLENEEFNLIFKGKINSNGQCIIPIKKLKILSEDLKGKLQLEVIVDNDTYFIPYKDDFIIDVSKKVTVEVVENKDINKKVIVEVNNKPIVVENNNVSLITNKILNTFKNNNININNIKSKTVLPLISEIIKKYNLNPKDIYIIQKQILTNLIKDLK